MEKIIQTNNPSTFDIFRIGPILAKLLSRIDGGDYSFKIADYHAVLWDWVGNHFSRLGNIDEDCYILTTSSDAHPTYSEDICRSYDYREPRKDKAVCLGLHNRESDYYQNIVDGKITFYDYSSTVKQPLINLPYSDIMYGFIDYLIEYKLKNHVSGLSSNDISSSLNNYLIERCVQTESKLERKKDN